MHFKFSNPFLWMVLSAVLAVLSYGCSPRIDLAPVITDEQRNSQYNLPTTSPGPDLDGGSPSAPAGEQTVIKENRTNVHSDLSNSQKNSRPDSSLNQPAADYSVARDKGSLFSRGSEAGDGKEMLDQRNDGISPSQTTKQPVANGFNPDSKDQIRIDKKQTDQRIEGPSETGESVGSGNQRAKVEKRTYDKSGQSVDQSKKKKKKSIVSIDNKNILMLNFQWPLKGKIKKYFYQTDKKGIDIAGRTGQSVRASESGKVVYSGQGLIGFGKLLIIKHNNEYLSAYANNGDLFVKEGQHVKKGQGIAKLGATLTKKAYLHFEIRKNGKPVNPLSLLPQY